jgi:dipeptidyl aminopeptidase/acylaminoacyl peptidase
MRHFLRAIVLGLAFGPVLAAQGPTVPIPAGVTVEGVPPIPREIADTLAKYADYRSTRFVAWHPTKRQILIVTQKEGVPQLFSVESPGRDKTPVTSDASGVSQQFVWAQFDPANPGTLVFVKDAGGGKEAYNLYRYDVSSGQTTLLTDGKSRYAAPPLATPVWAPQGKWIAYDSTERDGVDRDLWVMQPSDPATARRLGDFEGIWLAKAWSPDATTLLAANTKSSGSDDKLWRIDVRTGARRPIVDVDEKGAWDAPQYSPDGRTIYAISNRGSGVPRIWKTAVDAPMWFAVTPEDEPVSEFAVSPDGQMAAVIFDRGSTDALQVIDLGTRKPRTLRGVPAGLLGDLQWRRGSREIAFTLQNARDPGDVYSLDTSIGAPTRWTASEVGAFDPDSLPPPEIVSWKGVDGLPITGVLYRPSKTFTGPRPLMINFHGGPALRWRPIFYGRSNDFLNELGVAILNPNYRGSDGFGPAFEAADNGTKRELVLDDVGAMLDWVASRPEFDKRRVMLTGASYGGYLALEAGIRYNDRIRCVYEGAGQTNLVTYLEQTVPSRKDDRRAEFGDERDPEIRKFLLSISPITRAAEMKTPLGIAHPANDTRVPVSQAREMVEAVKKNGVPVWYMEYAGVGHDDLLRPREFNDFNFACWIQFVKMYLLGEPAP